MTNKLGVGSGAFSLNVTDGDVLRSAVLTSKAKWVREPFYWNMIEPVAPTGGPIVYTHTFHWDDESGGYFKWDTALADFQAKGINVIATIVGLPQWACTNRTVAPTKVYYGDEADAVTDYTTEASNAGADYFPVSLVKTGVGQKYLYIMLATKFDNVSFVKGSPGTPQAASGVISAKYWNGSNWVVSGSGESYPTGDRTSNGGVPFSQDGVICFTKVWGSTDYPSWATKTINGQTGYWMRLETSADLTAGSTGDQLLVGRGFLTDGWTRYYSNGYLVATGDGGLLGFIMAVLTRYPAVKAVEVLNETDISSSYPGYFSYFTGCLTSDGDAITGAEYEDLINPMYTYVKAAYPNISFIMAGMAMESSVSTSGWFADFLNAGGASFTDAINIHAYAVMESNWDVPGTYEDIVIGKIEKATTGVRAIMNTYSVNKPIWITECSCLDQHLSEANQTLYLTKMFARGLSLNAHATRPLTSLLWYWLRDSASGSGDDCGFVNEDNSIKTTHSAYKPVGEWLADAVYDSTLTAWGTVSDIEGYKFVIGDKYYLYVLWSTAGGTGHEHITAKRITKMDKSGNRVQVWTAGTDIEVSVTFEVGEPIYLLVLRTLNINSISSA